MGKLNNLINKYQFRVKPNTKRRKFASQAIGLRGYHHFKLKIKQLLCLHGNYVYLEITAQRKEAGGNLISFARGCKKCGWVNMSSPGYGMPRTLRNSYDRTYLKITDKHDRLWSDIENDKAKTKLQREFDAKQKVNDLPKNSPDTNSGKAEAQE